MTRSPPEENQAHRLATSTVAAGLALRNPATTAKRSTGYFSIVEASCHLTACTPSDTHVAEAPVKPRFN